MKGAAKAFCLIQCCLYIAFGNGMSDQVGGMFEVEFGADIVSVALYSAQADEKLTANLTVGAAFGD